MKGLLLASGGIDSTVLMYALAKKKYLKGVVFCDYGQKTAAHCRRIVEWHAKRLKLPVYVERVHVPKVVQHGITPGVFKEGFKPPNRGKFPTFKRTADLEKYRLSEWSWIDGRNTLFVLYAAIRASVLGETRIYTAFQFDEDQWEDETPIDTSPEYVAALNNLFCEGAFLREMEVEAPFLDDELNKEEIVELGRKLKVDLTKTYSCEFWPACGTCNQCLVRFDVLK